MTDAERQARHRAAHSAGAPVIRTRRPADHRGRARRWHDTVAELTELQAQSVAWRDALPANPQDGAPADASQAIRDLDLAGPRAIDPPRGFGRDRHKRPFQPVPACGGGPRARRIRRAPRAAASAS